MKTNLIETINFEIGHIYTAADFGIIAVNKTSLVSIAVFNQIKCVNEIANISQQP